MKQGSLLLLLLIYMTGCKPLLTAKNVPSVKSPGFILQPAIRDGNTIFIAIEAEPLFAGAATKMQVDTGSPYTFVGAANNNMTLPCPVAQQGTYQYGAGNVIYCNELGQLKCLQDSGFVAFGAQPFHYGQALFFDWYIQPGIMGVAANFGSHIQSRSLTPTIEQIKPAYLSFQWPDGLLKNGYMTFSALQNQQQPITIGLDDPGALGYGYTANIQEIRYFTDANSQNWNTRIIKTPTGVFLQKSGNSYQTRIASTMNGYFDTGTTSAFAPFNGDIDLLGSDTGFGYMKLKTSVNYKKVEVDFKQADGSISTLSAEDFGPLETNSIANGDTSFQIPTASLIDDYLASITSTLPGALAIKNKGKIDQLTFAIGLNFIGQYNFSFQFAPTGRALKALFYTRSLLP